MPRPGWGIAAIEGLVAFFAGVVLRAPPRWIQLVPLKHLT